MVTAATSFTSLGLPVLVWLPNIPSYAQAGASFSEGSDWATSSSQVSAVQTYNKFGKKTALIAAIAVAVAFGIWEAFLEDMINGLKPILGRNIGGFPGTVMIISGWAPIIAWKLLSERRKAAKMPNS